jgi:hypothetical protein
MKRLLLAACILASATAHAVDADCSSIKQDKQRLACYDRGGASKANAAASSAVKSRPKQFRSHSWVVDEEINAMTDKKQCTALYKNSWTIQGTDRDLYISLKGRGGVRAYTLRFDDEPADSLQLARDMEKEISAVMIGSDFDRAYSGKRLRVQVQTILNSIILEDIDLNGFKEAVDYIRSNCQA